MKNSKSPLPIYQIGMNTLNLDIEKYGVPYYFILHPDMKTSDFMLLDNSFPQVKKRYFEKVQKILLNEK
jgi:hypothetical protein